MINGRSDQHKLSTFQCGPICMRANVDAAGATPSRSHVTRLASAICLAAIVNLI